MPDEGALTEDIGRFGQLAPVVDPDEDARVFEYRRRDRGSFRCQKTDRIGQVVLALSIRGRKLRENPEERHGVEAVDPGVDFADLALVGGCILLLHDRHRASVRVADQTAVARRVRHDAGRDGRRSGLFAMDTEECVEDAGIEERSVAGRHDDRAIVATEGVFGHPHRVAGSELLGLDREPILGAGQRLAHGPASASRTASAPWPTTTIGAAMPAARIARPTRSTIGTPQTG